jgi:fucose 4-O-acetylase-like acetyltransferase
MKVLGPKIADQSDLGNSASVLDGRQKSRILWIDVAKGLAISLVVFGHVLGGANARGWVKPADAAEFIYNYIYSFHMPLFFLLSGSLAIDAIRANPRRALFAKMASILWPYLLWGVIFIALEPVISQFMLSRPDASLLPSVKKLLIGETSWFLWTLFFIHCIVILLSQAFPLYVLLIISIFSSIALGKYDLGATSALVHFMPFFVVGAMIGKNINKIKCASRAASFAYGLIAFGSLSALVTYQLNENPVMYLCCGLLGSLASILLARAVGAVAPARLLARIGVASLVIFLLHPYFQGATRELTLRALGSSPWVQLSIPTAVAILGPTFIFMLSERFGLQWLFNFERLLVSAGPEGLARTGERESRSN